MNELTQRTIFGAAYVAALVLSIMYSPILFGILSFIFIFVGHIELNNINVKRGGVIYLSTPIFLLGSVIAALIIFSSKWDIPLGLLAIASSIAIILNHSPFKRFTAFLSLSYLIFPMGTMVYLLYNNHDYSWMLVLSFFIFIWCSDTFAYVVGKMIGRTKLAPKISPKKTWEGFFGGMVFTMAAGALLAHYWHLPYIDMAVAAGVVCIFGVIGDLYESTMKRQAEVKDSGKFIPGHGGILDRLDSALYAFPFYLIALYLIQLI